MNHRRGIYEECIKAGIEVTQRKVYGILNDCITCQRKDIKVGKTSVFIRQKDQATE
jgi:hypothetical protein